MLKTTTISRKFSSISRRAAYDIGSGSIKFQIADIDLKTNKIVKNHIQKAEQVLFVNEKKFTKRIQDEGLSKLMGLQRLSESFGVTQSLGVATQAFRNSENGRECLDFFQEKLNFPLKIVSSKEEARLGFECANAITSAKEEELLVWDCGAGSYQLTSKDHEFSDKFGSGAVLKIAENIKKGPGPMTKQDFNELLGYLMREMKPLPEWIYVPLNQWIAIGSAHSIFNQQRILSGKDEFTTACVEATIEECISLDHKELFEFERSRYELVRNKIEYDVIPANAEYILPKLALLLSVMTKADVPMLQYVQTNGNCNALLTNPQLWQDMDEAHGAAQSNHTASALPSNAKPPSPLLTVNWHLEKDCNYKCSFCYAHFEHVRENLDLQEGFKLIKALREESNFYKINFAGGEPLMNKNLGQYIKFAKEEIGLKTSIITNASRLTRSWLLAYGPYLDQIGVSCDSLNDTVQKQLGRGFGNHVEITKRAFRRIREMNEDFDCNIAMKLNTVVLRHNYMEDWSEFILENGIQRWKIFKILEIQGENEASYNDLSITEEQFQMFVARHEHLRSKGVTIAEENNADMTQSYIMVTPDGKFYQNNDDDEYRKYQYSENILDVGVKRALECVGFDSQKFEKRGGSYEL